MVRCIDISFTYNILLKPVKPDFYSPHQLLPPNSIYSTSDYPSANSTTTVGLTAHTKLQRREVRALQLDEGECVVATTHGSAVTLQGELGVRVQLREQ